ncbi:MAG TPA: tripartite tricarboxylate transporter TctB family protein [Burkholderiaceae bacterium]|nr:tripartite tricarboxylate transporter TctB family protein [Burkholderiaceae bacterium]
MKIRNQRDFWAGIMFLVTGLLFIALSQQYQLGTAAKMGPGYFPTVLGGLMAFLGILISWGSTAKSNPLTSLTKVGWRELTLVLLAVAAFGFLLPRLGMVLSLIALIGIAAVAGHEFRLRDTLLSMVLLLIISYGVFVYGLELQFPVWPTFLTR